MITLLAAVASMALGRVDAPALVCTVNSKDKANSEVAKVDYNGVRYGFCCADCQGGFLKNPTAALSAKKPAGATYGESLFDPVSYRRIAASDAKGWSDVGGVRYYFAKADGKKTFDANVKKYVTNPTKVSMNCPVTGEAVASYADAAAAVDYKGVRYLICCAGCIGTFTKTPEKFLAAASKHAVAPKAHKVE